MPIAPKKYGTIAAARAAREQGKIKKPMVTVEKSRFCIRDMAGAVRLDLPLADAVLQLCKSVGFRAVTTDLEAR